jgi:D-arabinose 1-dehydrogenase-like Zn-dependent alcohol dehydrogenase
MRSVQVSKVYGNFEIVEREVPKPGDIKVQACGICHSDSLMITLGLLI